MPPFASRSSAPVKTEIEIEMRKNRNLVKFKVLYFIASLASKYLGGQEIHMEMRSHEAPQRTRADSGGSQASRSQPVRSTEKIGVG